MKKPPPLRGFAINWQQQSNTWINLINTPFTCLTVIPMTIPLLLLLWNEIWVEIQTKKAVDNKRSIANYIYRHTDVILEHLPWTMHNGSFKSPSFSTFIHWFQIKTPHENQTARKHLLALMLGNTKNLLQITFWTHLYKVM